MNLKAPCPHGRYDPHAQFVKTDWPERGDWTNESCPGGVLLPPDTLVIVKENGGWPFWAVNGLSTAPYVPGKERIPSVLDALAAAQPGTNE